MITYSSMTLGEVIDALFMKMERHRTSENFDWSSLRDYVNHAVREVLVNTLPYKEWAYNNVLDVTHGTTLPQTFIAPIRCMLSEDGDPPYTEARRVKPEEFYDLGDWYGGNTWARASTREPVYTMWGDNKQVNIYLYPNDQWETGSAPTGYTYYGADMSGKLECYLSPPQLTNSTDILPVPYDFEDLVILSALSRVFSRANDIMRLSHLQQRMQAEQQKLLKLYQAKLRLDKRELESYVEPLPPLVERGTEPGEVGDRG